MAWTLDCTRTVFGQEIPDQVGEDAGEIPGRGPG